MTWSGERLRVRLRLFAAISLIGLGGCMADDAPLSTDLFSAAYGSEEDAPRKLFISGHSLTNRPFPDFLAGIAEGAGRSLEWNMQHIEGSSLRMRTRGDGSSPWIGYRQGSDRDRGPIDVLEELEPRAGGAPYDTLILNEVHTLLESLIWNDTVGNALDYERRFSAANPDGRTYLFASWLNVDDLDDPTSWIAYERAAIKAWQCTVMQINARLADGASARPVRLIPAAPALAALVEQAISEEGVDGLSAATPRETLTRLFTDDVHLTEAGNYYVALVSHIALNGSLPDAPWAPAGLDPARADALQAFARRFMAQWLSEQSGVSIDCSRYLADEFAGAYLAYVRDAKWRAEDGRMRSYYKWARFSIEWPRFLRGDSAANPFRTGAQ